MGCHRYSDRKFWTVFFLSIFGATFLAGAIMLPIAILNFIYVDALTVEADFPPMVNDEPLAGMAEVTAIWSRPVAACRFAASGFRNIATFLP